MGNRFSTCHQRAHAVPNAHSGGTSTPFVLALNTSMTRHHQRPGRKSEQSRFRGGESLGEQRYQELMRGLNQMFQEFGKDVPPQTAVDRQEVIEEIKALMARHGLTIEDLGEVEPFQDG